MIAGEIGQHILVANALHNLGFTAMRSGDLPTAMQEFERAEQGMVAAGAMSYLPPIHAEHALALADAALFDDAESLLAKALPMLEEQGNEIEMAYVLLSVSALRLAKGDLDGAQAAAEAAATWYRKQQRVGWMAVATHYALQAAARRDDPEPSLADQLVQIGEALRQNGFGAEATLAELSAARLRASLVAMGRGLSPRCSVDVRSRDVPSTASCWPTSTPSRRSEAAIVLRRAGRSVGA